MTTLEKLIFENSNNEENKEAIISLANQTMEYVIYQNDSIEWGDVNNDGTIDWGFTQDALDEENEQDLSYEADSAFYSNFNSQVRMELPECF